MKLTQIGLIATTLVAPVAIIGCQNNEPSPPANVSASPSTPTVVADLPNPPEGYSATLVDAFEDGDRFNQFRGTWFTYDDKNQGGDSQVIPEGYSAFRPRPGGIESSTKIAEITGNVTTTYPDGFVGFGTDLNPNNTTPRDLSEYDAIEFWAKGDGKTYRMKIHSAATSDYDDYGYDVVTSPEWKRHVISFEELQQEGWGQSVNRQEALETALKIQWQTIGQPHESINLAVDNIRLLESQ